MEEAAVLLGVGALHVGETAHGFIGEEQAEHAANGVQDERYAVFLGGCVDRFGEVPRGPVEGVVEGFVEGAEEGEASAHGQGIAGQRAGLVDVAGGRDSVHDLGLAPERTDGKAAADHLAERGQVGVDAVCGLGAASVDSKTRHHLVKDEHAPRVYGDFAQCLEKARCRGNAAHVARDGFDDDGRDVLANAGEDLAHGIGVVEWSGQRMLGGIGGHAGRVGKSQGQQPRAGGGE